MTRLLLVAAALGFAVSSAGACEYLRSAQKLDSTTTASVETKAMSTPEMAVPTEQKPADKVLAEEEG